MKANELRLRNYIQIMDGSGHDCQPTEITSIKENSVGISCKIFNLSLGTYYQLEDLEPIPLTEEWLLKLGFKKNGEEYSITMMSLVFVIQPPKPMGEWQTFYSWIYDTFKFSVIKYVHELQNLYFALSGEELEIK